MVRGRVKEFMAEGASEGVVGYSFPSIGYDIGVFGLGGSVGVYGEASVGVGTYAGYFAGDVDIIRDIN